MARGVGERALSEAGPAEAAIRDRVLGLDGLVAVTVGVLPGIEPDLDALLDAWDRRVDPGGTAYEERGPGDHEPDLRSRHVQHREEDPEVEEAAAEVVRHDEDEHRRAPDQEERPEVLEPELRQHLALLAQVAGEEDDEQDLRQLAGVEV